MEDRKHYGAIDGLRTIAAIGIVMMHMGANNTYAISDFVYDRIIPSFKDFVFLFMVLSSFGMCCGYYKKILNNQILISDFYKKRWQKAFPFFALLVVVDLIASPSIESLYEGFVDVTLMFGLLPNTMDISVIGVGWFLGLIFVFYLCFPFFCFLLENKRRAWFSFGISLIYNFICSKYIAADRSNILYSACYFIAGGLIYLYRDEIRILNRWIVLAITCILVAVYYVFGGNTFTWLSISVLLLSYAVLALGGVLENKFMRFFSGISMEVYLSHMFIFRVIERLGLNIVLGNGWIQYIVTVIMVTIGSSIFSMVMQQIFKLAERRMALRRGNGGVNG